MILPVEKINRCVFDTLAVTPMGLSICHWLRTYGSSLGLTLPSNSSELISTSAPFWQVPEQTTLLRGIAARITQEMGLSQCTIFDIAVLAEVLELPFTQAWPMLQPLAMVTSQLLRQLSRKRPLRRNEGTWLSFQIAYLRALDELLTQEASLHRPWLDAAQISLTAAQTLSEETLAQTPLTPLIASLRPQRLTDTQAEQALVSGSQSLLVQQIRQVMVTWLTFNGAEEREAQLLIQRLEHGLVGHLLATIAENATPLAQLQKFVRLGHLATWSRPTQPDRDYELIDEGRSSHITIEPQQELYRAQLLQSLNGPLLGQVFCLRDLYIPPRGLLKTGDSAGLGATHRPDSSLAKASLPAEPLEDALDWATEQLVKPGEIPILEAEAGQGKTCFCQMFAVRLAQDFYPNWMPIVISLRGLLLGATLEETLAPALPSGLFTERESWLAAHNPPCVLILDGLEELPLGPDGEGQLSRFLRQIQAFQDRYRNEKGVPRHRILLTSQPELFATLLKTHPEMQWEQSYPRLQIQPMDQADLKLWFRHWAILQTKAIAQSYFNFLKKGGAFRGQSHSAVKELAHWPSTLLLMALLHRDGFLDERIFSLSVEALQFEIFERLQTWLLGAATDAYPQPGLLADLSRNGPAHASRSTDGVANLLAGRSPRQVRQQIQGAALRILQSGRGQWAEEAVLPEDNLLPESGGELAGGSWEQPLPNFYFREQSLASKQRGWVFRHSFLGDYSGAEAIALALQTVTQRIQTPYGEAFALESAEQVALHLYRLLGHAPLSPRLVNFILERLRREQQRESPGVSLEILSDRLHEFYRYYCRGRWLDEGIPQTAHQMLRVLHNPFSMLQVDAAVGLNVFTLLCRIAQESTFGFCPCGDSQRSSDYNPNRLSQFIGRTSILSPFAFWVYARQHLAQLHLPKAHLNQVMLAGANLQGIQAEDAAWLGSNLEGADLTDAYLVGCNLQRANLRHSLLCRTNLQGADLRYADLTGATLVGVNLSNACVAHAHLDAAAIAIAQQSGAFFSMTEYQVYQQLVQEEAASLPRSTTPDRPLATHASEEEATLSAEQPPASALDTTSSYRFDEEETTTATLPAPQARAEPPANGWTASQEPVEAGLASEDETIAL